MRHKITSTIEIGHRGCDMPLRHRRHRSRSPEIDNSASLDEKYSEDGQRYVSTATSHRNRLFHNVNDGVHQSVNVEVHVEKEKADDCVTSCFGAIGACFGKGAKSAAS